MNTYGLIPGADGRAWYWHRLTPLIQSAGHSVVAVDLPVSDPSAGLAEYAQSVVSAVGARGADVVLVARSLAGFIAPLVTRDITVDQIILLNAMVPRPGESAGEWWGNTGQEKARADYYRNNGLVLPAEFDPFEAFFHDVPAKVVDEAMRMGAPVSRFDRLFAQSWPLEAWPNVPTRFIQARDDRFLPLDFQRRVVAERLAIPVEQLPGGHLVALSQPAKLAEILLSF